MREEKMRELMQQEPAVPQKVHDGFEKGLEQVAHMDIGETGNGQKERWGFWRRVALIAVAAIAVCAVGFHSQIYSFAKSLFIHDVINMGKEDVAQETDARIIQIKDGILSVNEWRYFESMEDLGGKLGISFLKSSAENDVTGKGRVSVLMMDDGEVMVSDDCFVAKGISKIHYTEDGTTSSHIDRDDAYMIRCKANFYTKAFQDSYGIEYEDGVVIEDYETANGLHARLFQYGDRSALNALLYCDNIRYEFEANDFGQGNYAIKDLKAFLDTLTK